MIEERYLASGLSPGVAIVCLIATILAMFSGLIVLLSLALPGRHGRPEQQGEAERRRFFALNAFNCITLVASYVFNVVWEPTNDEFWIAMVPIAYIAIASIFAGRPQAKRRRVAGAIFAASLFIANGFGAILPQTKLESDYWYQANRFLIQNARAGDVVVTDGGSISDSYLVYYTRSTVVAVHRIAPAELGRVLSNEHRGKVWVSSKASEPSPEVRATGYLKGRDDAGIRAALEKVSGRLIKRDESRWQTISQLEASSADARSTQQLHSNAR
jgi:hypothetical protein